QRTFDLREEEDLKDYLSKSSSLNSPIPKGTSISTSESKGLPRWEKFQIQLKARDFFLFGAGFGDGDVDHISKMEKVITWSGGFPSISESDYILIPATSIKGTLAHRVRFHYSKLIEDFIESPKDGYQPEVSIDLERILREIESQIDFNNLTTETGDEVFKTLEHKVKDFDPLKSAVWNAYEDQLRDEASNLIKAGSEQDESNYAVEKLFGFTK